MYQRCVAALRQELDVEISQHTRDLYERLSAGAGAGPSSDGATCQQRIVAGTPDRAGGPSRAGPRLHNLPTQPVPFVGREAVLREIAARLEDPNCRLLTLVGPGGSGKTRLALEAGAAQLNEFEHGVFFVSLAPVQSTEGIVPTAAQALGLSFHGEGEPENQLLAYLRRRRMLIILDSFEHLLGGPHPCQEDGSWLITAILEIAPEVKVLVTSRAALRVQAESLFPVTGMAYPEGAAAKGVERILEDAAAYGAVRLFVQSARRVGPHFRVRADNISDVVRICHLVAGMPLGILLASSWVRVLPPGEIAAQLATGLDVLETDLRDVPERQRSMRAVFDHSWGLLTDRERDVMQALSVFRGVFTRQAARAVAGASLRDLRSLVDRSLVQPTSGGRYQMHELMRQYAMEKLAEAPAADEVAHERHCDYYVAALEEWEEDLGGLRQQAALAEMDAEIDNTRASWKWAVDQTQIERIDRALGGLCRFYFWRSRCQELEADCKAAANALADAIFDAGAFESADGPCGDTVAVAERLRVLARIMRWQGAATHATGHKEAGRQLVDKSLALLDRPELAGVDTRRERASILLEMASQTRDFDVEKSRRLTAQSLALYEAVGDPWWTAYALLQLGLASWFVDAYGDAREQLSRSLARFRTLGDRREIAWLNCHLGGIAMHQGRLEEAEHLFREAIARHEEIGDPLFYANGILCLVATLLYSGRFAEAQTLLNESATAIDSVGDPVYPASTLWSTGFGDMHLGRWEQAMTRTQTSLALCREAGLSLAVAQSFWTLSCMALVAAEHCLDTGVPPLLAEADEAQEAYAEARRLAQESVSVLREMRVRRGLASILAVLGAADRGLGNLDQAHQHVSEALRICCDTGAFQPSLFVLPAAALLLAHEGEEERAVELYALASSHPFVGNSRWFRDVFGWPITAAAAELPPDVVAAARERGRARDMQVTLLELTEEFER